MANVIAIILAAGQGARFGGTDQKAMFPLCGRPVLSWSIERLGTHAAVTETILVVPPGLEPAFAQELERGGAVFTGKIVAGGDTRQQSSWLGLQEVPEHATHVVVHDAARPCVSAGLLERVIEALEKNNAVVPTVPVVDTLVRDRENAVDAIIDRVFVAGVQTPQGFEKGLLLRAHRHARARGFASSDEGSLVLALGERVATVPGDRSNIKITYPEDVVVAEAILGRTG